MGHFFFIAALPALSLEATPTLTWDGFLALCAEHLPPATLALLEETVAADITRPATNPLIREWRTAEIQLRNAVVRARALRKNLDPGAFLQPHDGFSVEIENSVAEAFTRPTPLDREQALDRARWRVAERLAGFDPFATVALQAYALKLRIATRWAAWNEGQARTLADEIVTQAPIDIGAADS